MSVVWSSALARLYLDSFEYTNLITDNKAPANACQYGGTHYKGKAIQPWDFIAANRLGFFEGNAVKYVCRWQDKGGTEDLRKAIHYLEKLIELNEPEETEQ